MFVFCVFGWWISFAILVGVFAETRRNRSGIGWSFLALLISPLLAGVLLAILKPILELSGPWAIKRGRRSSNVFKGHKVQWVSENNQLVTFKSEAEARARAAELQRQQSSNDFWFFAAPATA